jgi:hypothetical protein
MYGGITQLNRIGFIEIESKTRRDATEIEWQIMITGIVDEVNPPNGKEHRSTLILPLIINIPNDYAPTLRNPPPDIRLTVKDNFQFRFSSISDKDFEDTVLINGPNFGTAESFVKGSFPAYSIYPQNNQTDPGIHEVSLTLTDDNPNPRSTVYNFKIYVAPLPPEKEKNFGINKTELVKKTNPSSKLNVKIKLI